MISYINRKEKRTMKESIRRQAITFFFESTVSMHEISTFLFFLLSSFVVFICSVLYHYSIQTLLYFPLPIPTNIVSVDSTYFQIWFKVSLFFFFSCWDKGYICYINKMIMSMISSLTCIYKNDNHYLFFNVQNE
jgi:hypothetical protein